MRIIIVGVLVLLVGCGAPAQIQQADFAERMASALCDRTHECMRGAFDAQYFDRDDCRSHVEISLRGLVTALDESGADCVYDATRAGAAYADLLEMSCERVYENAYVESLSAVWDCDVFLPPVTLQ
jgi:hypothetical protein